MRRLIGLVGPCLVLTLLLSGLATADDKPAPKQDKQAAAKKEEPKQEKAKPAAETKSPKKSEEKKGDEAAPAKKAEEAKPAEKESPETSKPAEEKKPEPKTITVEPELMKIDVSLEGTFESGKMAEVILRPETWSSFKVLEAVEHGQEVRRGEVLVEFDPKSIDEAIADAKTNARLEELSLEQTEAEVKTLERSTPLNIAQAEREKEYNDEDIARYFEVDKPLTLKSLKENLEYAKDSLEYQQEELRQLEQMYNEDELTEETEEIVLRRQRDAVRRAEFSYEIARNRYERDMNVYLPRDETMLKHADRMMNLAFERTMATLPSQLTRAKLDLEKQKVSQERNAEKFEKLQADRELMTLKSPIDGIVYFGRCVLGKWSGASSLVDKLRPGGSISPGTAIMTIVQPRPILLRVTVPEKELHWITPGLRGTVTPTGYPDVKASVIVSQVDAIPSAAGSFMAVLRVTLDEKGTSLMPGMKGEATLTPYLNKNALLVPESAISSDELEPDRKYVHLLARGGAIKKRSVTLGNRSDDKVEITRGVKVGDKVLVEAPEKD